MFIYGYVLIEKISSWFERLRNEASEDVPSKDGEVKRDASCAKDFRQEDRLTASLYNATNQ